MVEDPGLWKQIATYLWGLLIPAGVYIWNRQEKRIDHLEGVMHTKEEANERKEYVDHLLEDRRHDVIALHLKIDTRAEKLDEKISNLARDMHTGFSDIKDILLKR